MKWGKHFGNNGFHDDATAPFPKENPSEGTLAFVARCWRCCCSYPSSPHILLPLPSRHRRARAAAPALTGNYFPVMLKRDCDDDEDEDDGNGMAGGRARRQ